MAAAKQCRREFKFSVLVPARDYYPEVGQEEEVLLQGVIDAWFSDGDGITLVDFKSDRVSEDYGHYSERYKTQISVYREACLRAFGKMPVEVYLYYLRGGHPERIVL